MSIVIRKASYKTSFPQVKLGQLYEMFFLNVQVDENAIQAHRIVLAATIPYFHAMFTTDMMEAKQNEVTLKGMDYEALESLVNFAYTGRIMININNVQSIMMCASFLQLNKVKDACAKFLTRRLTSENVLGIRAFVDTLHCESVVKEADKFIQKHFLNVSRSDEFLQLSVSDVQTILGCDDLNVESEEQVYTVLMNWVRKDSEMRGVHLPHLLKFIRMPLLSPEFITDHVATETLIRSSHECRDLLDEARDYYLLPERRSSMQTFRTRPRCCDDVVGLIYVVGGLTKSGTWSQNPNLLNYSGDSISTVEVYDPLTDRWKVAEAMKMLRSRVGVAVMKNRLYAIGGFNGQERLATVEVYDPNTKAWSKVAPMNFRRSAVGAAALNDRLYVCGGYDGTSSLNTVECYYPEKNDWMMTTSMTKHRSAAGVVAFQGYIYALGGHDGLSIFDSVEKYDPQTGQWTPVAPMLTKRCRLGAASLNNKLYVCGGYDGSTFLRSVEVYDPIADLWTEIAPMSLMRSRVALVANLGKLWAIGGYDGASNLSTVEVYDPVKNTWKNAPPMCAHEGGVGVGVIPVDSS
ncbi:Kelch-like protein 18 [Orchesella cincta]|uniref:Kelch-like protein diablo n=1 Tax=Orchesella cincta TaxID=48709 RepID=A0A1D2NGJ0_ORCCI|nr:Kelch-like protein 18 [Orchesella cincta]